MRLSFLLKDSAPREVVLPTPTRIGGDKVGSAGWLIVGRSVRTALAAVAPLKFDPGPPAKRRLAGETKASDDAAAALIVS